MAWRVQPTSLESATDDTRTINGQEIETVAPEPTAKVVDLMEALKASVAAAKKQVDEPAAKKSPAKKTTAAKKKATAPAAKKKTTAKSAAKKTTATRKKAVGE